jgi:hypothetical protein
MHRSDPPGDSSVLFAASANMRAPLKYVLLFQFAIPLMANAVVLPSELHGKCKVTTGEIFLTDYDCGNLTLEDTLGNKLYLHFDGEPHGVNIWYGRSWKNHVQSHPGGPEERILLHILQQFLAGKAPSPPSPNLTKASNERYWNYTYARQIMNILKRRCR